MSQMNLDRGQSLVALILSCLCVGVLSLVPVFTADLITVWSARPSANIPVSLQTHRCSTNATWNGQLKARNCLFHQLPLLRDQLENNLISLAGKIRIEDTKGYVSVCLSKCIWSVPFFSEMPSSHACSLSLRCVRRCTRAWLQRTEFTHEIAFQHTQLHLHVY